ncbi:Na+/H+ antiporter NhaA [Dongshaea marina]|uniref:Na+/H+ antiporter NhaA n=1 Tax=Dongshaea marina TaxID=2047966 RepID=UPI000D3E63B7|nr:Na+/H+ antiporter NhaA [Dongshaea marina]
MLKAIREFLRLEAAAGIILVIAAIIAMIIENSAAKPLYDALLGTHVEVRLGALQIAKPLLLWINDGMMALFFLLVGLEIKRELLMGELSDRSRLSLPLFAAVGGMVVPALIYSYFNHGDVMAMRGWAIPAATDIAFALGVLSLLGSRVPHSLKLFLLTLAIIDDLGGIIIIALFYTSNLSLGSLVISALSLIVLYILNRRGVTKLTPYLLVGLILWIAVLKSGVHATLAGVLLAFFIPLKQKEGEEGPSLLEKLEHDLHPTVAYVILPVFAFANTGISLEGVTLQSLLHPVPMGIWGGLIIGKLIGVLGLSYLAVKLKMASLPDGIRWREMYGVSLLCGIGFTMSLFISSLAFEQGATGGYLFNDRLGILFGSILAAILGYLLLYFVLPKKKT